MNLRHKVTGKLCSSDRLNYRGEGEIIVLFEDDCDSLHISQFEVELGIGDDIYWKNLEDAFLAHDVIVDNHVTRFFEPKNAEDRVRGYTLD
jgi:hypothetical protein